MRLCYDATRFGSGLQEAVEIAAEKGLSACEYSFDSFETGGKSAKKLSADETEHLKSVADFCKEKDVEMSCLRLNTLLVASDKKSVRSFNSMIDKLASVADALHCKRIVFYLLAESADGWMDSVEAAVAPIVEKLNKQGIRLLMSTGTPAPFRGRSLKNWRPLEPQEWREIISRIQELSLSLSIADCVWQGIDYLRMLPNLVQVVDHVEAQDVEVIRQIISDNGYFGPLFWRYKIVGKGQVDWGQFVEALKLYDYSGSLSIQFNDEFTSENEQGLWDALESSTKLLAPLVKY